MFLERTVALGIVAATAAPVARGAQPSEPDGTLQAFADTILPGRKATRTDLGGDIHPQAIAGVDHRPGAVEADALALFHSPLIGFDALAPAFLADLESRALTAGGPFLGLGFDQRVTVVKGGLSFDNPVRLMWEAAAAVPFTAFCAATLVPEQDARHASGYRVMGLPGVAPHGYRRPSYGRKLAHERTKRGSLG
ncbi:MAG: hypothetical protein QOI80_286 [Solirubrobacteraceae bacterium]|nr:hypothetical protein [Solirubrobacteraceae bacterium]